MSVIAERVTQTTTVGFSVRIALNVDIMTVNIQNPTNQQRVKMDYRKEYTNYMFRQGRQLGKTPILISFESFVKVMLARTETVPTGKEK